MANEYDDPLKHRARHIELHRMLDELYADFIRQTDADSTNPISRFLKWSFEQTLVVTNPTRESFLHPMPAPHVTQAGVPSMIAQEDSELRDWLWGITNRKPSAPGDFLKSLADAALRADWENYPLMRPMLLQIKAKYPEYCDPYPDSPDDNRCVEKCPKCGGRCVAIRQHLEETKDTVAVSLHGCGRHAWLHGANEIDPSRSMDPEGMCNS